MSQQINDNFQLLAGIPIDDRNAKPTISARDSISSTRRFQGLLCFVEQTQTLYQLQGGILNSNWVGIAGNDISNGLETIIEGFYVLSAGKETLLDWEVGDKFRGWISNRYVVGTILTLPVSLPSDIDNALKVELAVDSDNSDIPSEYSNIVYVNNNNPNSATIFDINNPPVVNDDDLKNDVTNLYIGLDASTWVYSTISGTYETKTVNTTDNLPEGVTNLYFTTARVLATLLTGLSLITGGAIVSTDSILVSFGKIQKQITDLSTLVNSRIDNVEYPFACSDETSDLTVGTLITFRMPTGMTLSSVKLSLNVAPTLAKVIVDIKKNGTSIFSTLISVDTSSTTSVGASVAYVLSTTSLADDDIMAISTTQVGSGVAGKGLKVSLIGKRV